MNNISLIEATKLIEKVNKSKDYNAYFSKGNIVVESNIIEIRGGYDGNNQR